MMSQRLHSVADNTASSLDSVVTLITSEYGTDDMLCETKSITGSRVVFCAELPLFQSEFYKAAQSDIKPAKCLKLDSEEYGGETEAEYCGKSYSIYRFFERSDGFTELYLEDRGGIRK